MKSVLLNYATPVNDRAIDVGYMYDPFKAVNVCSNDNTKVYSEHQRQVCGLQTKTEVAREQDDSYPIDLCLQTKTFAQMEQDDQGFIYNE